MPSRRHLLAAAALAAPSLALARPAWAPSRPVRFVVPFPAGGATDVAARILAERMAPHLGPAARLIVENRAGAGGSVGAEWVRHRAPDGYTLVLGSASAMATNPAALPGQTPYDPVEDFSPIALVGGGPMVLVVPANSELLERSGVDLAELADQKWITRTENPVAEVLHRSCRLAGFEPDISYESHDYHEAQAMVAAGLGIAIAPRLALTNRRHDVRLIAFESRGRPAPARRILLARPVNRTPTPATEVMIETLRAVAPKFAATNLHLAQLGTVRAR